MKTEKQKFINQSVELDELAKEWKSINLYNINQDIFKLQQKIFRAETKINIVSDN